MVVDDREPHAARGWGIRFPRPGQPRCRVMIGAQELPALERRPGRRLLALTITEVRTLVSVQFKGPSGPPQPATADDLDVVQRYSEAFFTIVEEVDGTPRALLERMLPTEFVVCEVDVEELYDQTPGPRAGTPIEAPR
jgi:hypothetical protein